MLAVSAWQLRHGGRPGVFARSARLALIVLLPAMLFAMLVGGELGVIEGRYQPMKIAAAEAQWTTCQPCSFSIFQIGGGNNDQTPDPDPGHPAPAVPAGHQPLERQGHRAEPAAAAVQPRSTARATTCRTCSSSTGRMRVMAYLAGPGPADRRVGAVAGPAAEAGHLPAVPVGGDLGGGAAVRDEHGRLAADRERPPAVGRAGHPADQERGVADRSAPPGRGSAWASSSCSTARWPSSTCC